MTSVQKHAQRMAKFIDELEAMHQQQAQWAALSKLLEEKKIDFDTYTTVAIQLLEKRLDYSKGKVKNREVLTHMWWFAIHIHEKQWTNGEYQDELEPISDAIDKVKKKHGLTDGEYWPLGEGPKEYQELEKQYDEVLNRKSQEVLKEILPPKTYKKFSNDIKYIEKQHFKEVMQRVNASKKKSRSKPAKDPILRLMSSYEKEAQACFNSKAYRASGLMIGSALECLLIHLLSKDIKKTKRQINALCKKKVIKSKKLLEMGLNDLVKLAYSLGFASDIVHEDRKIVLIDWLHLLREARNLVHPGRIIRREDYDMAFLGKKDVEILRTAYKLIKAHNKL